MIPLHLAEPPELVNVGVGLHGVRGLRDVFRLPDLWQLHLYGYSADLTVGGTTYPVAPGSNQYVLGRPFMNRATLTLPNGKRFAVVADGLSATNGYVGKVTLNGKPLARSYITHDELSAGGELRFTMQAKPNRSWATSRAARPFSTSTAR